MFSLLIEEKMKGVGAAFLTDFFIVLILLIFFVSLIVKKVGWWPQFTSYSPTLLTSMGILGTFAGIITGLLEFDTDSKNIDASIPLLLDGLKTAFISSLAGMSASIIYRVVATLPLMKPKRNHIEIESIGINELYAAMNTQTHGVDKIYKALGGDGERSIANQFSNLHRYLVEKDNTTQDVLQNINQANIKSTNLLELNRQTFDGFQNTLWNELRKFAEMLSESASKHVIDALNNVIADFNNNLTEQFGDNFKKLNEAVAQLITWQDQYKSQLLEMNAQYQQGVQAITTTGQSVATIELNSQKIPVNMEKMRNTMELLQKQIEDIENHLTGLANLRTKAEEMQPAFRRQLEEVIQTTKEANNSISNAMKSNAESLVKSSTDFKKK